MKIFVFELFICLLNFLCCVKCIDYDISSGSFDDLNIVLSPNRLNASQCPEILKNLKTILTSASALMYTDLNNRLGKVNVRIPKSWTDDYCYTEGHIKEHQPFQIREHDVLIGPYDRNEKGQIWTQQSQGCHHPGDFIYIPHPPLLLDKASQKNSIKQFFNQWVRFHYGLFTNDFSSTNVSSGSLQDSFCYGAPPRSMIKNKNARLTHPKAMKRPLSNPDFVVSREIPAKYVIVLENSRAMNVNNTWDLIKTALKKLIHNDLDDPDIQMGLVLFNENANIARTVTKIGAKNENSRTSISVQIRHKYDLSHKVESRVRAGVIKAIEALQTSGNTIGANIILISQGHINAISREDEKEIRKLAKKHELRIHTLPLVHDKTNISTLFESISYHTGGNSFFIESTKSDLELYMDLLDSLREIRARSETNGPALIYEHKIMNSLKSDETGSFHIDEHIGTNTMFNLYTMGSSQENGFVQGIRISDNRGKMYDNIVEQLQYHYLKVFDVPFDEEMEWKYEFNKVHTNSNNPNNFGVQVVSSPRIQDEFIQVKLYTNRDTHAIHVSKSQPLKFFVEVKLNGFPVIEAQVKLIIKVTKHANSKDYNFVMDLLDNGNGDPDIQINDGVYSRYFTEFSAGEGRYDIEIQVSNNKGTARLPASNYTISTRSVKLRSFSRIIKGDSLRIMSIAPASTFSPARILDLKASIEEKEVLLIWTAPGNILDMGRVMSYKIFSSELSDSFYKRKQHLLKEIAAKQRSGVLEQTRLPFHLIKTDSYLAIQAVSKNGKVSNMSNVVHIQLPDELIFKFTHASQINQLDISSNDIPTKNMTQKSDKILFYVLFAVIAIVLLCILAVLIILKRYQNVKSDDDKFLEDPMDDLSVIDVTELMVNQTKTQPILTGFQKNNQSINSILKNNHLAEQEEELCNCHEVYNNPGAEDLVINPYINYSSLSSYQNRSVRQEPIYQRQEPIYQNQQEIYGNREQPAAFGYPIYSVVNKPNKNVRIQLQNELTDDNDDDDTEAETEHTDEDRCLTPSNTYLEISFENQNQAQPKKQQQQSPQKILPSQVYNSTPNGKVRTITQV